MFRGLSRKTVPLYQGAEKLKVVASSLLEENRQVLQVVQELGKRLDALSQLVG